ncbi:hypothetical protein PV327_007110 [Microctonus hyperodae]|uniref:Protein FAM177A1 n=1 Tax=Microctonus hyperodae TaxID=165561 RepID=A0AA39F5V4_MICHY|nr:hypothetical protein PV327_007110 [Microctonus hyperodae]
MSTITNNDCDLSNVVLHVNGDGEEQKLSKPRKQPSRILHFSDGDLVEYSDDEVDTSPKSSPQKALVDPKTLGWLPWTWYQTTLASSKLLEGCDYVGEALADFLGITSPKYHFEIQEYKRQQLAEAEEKLKADQETKGWITANKNSVIMEDVRIRE